MMDTNSIHHEQLEIIHNKLYDLISDLKYLNETNYWGDGDYCETKKCLDKALTLIVLKLERESRK